MKYPAFKSKEEEIDFMRKHQSIIIAEKKMAMKTCDPIHYIALPVDEKGDTIKAATQSQVDEMLNSDKLKVRAIINTTMIMDSHKDVHIDGLWKRSLDSKKQLLLLKEHKMSFESIISDDVKPYTKTFTWEELGFSYPGKTQALVFESIIEKDRNPYMFEQYAKGRVKNHSVGMGYVKIGFATANDNYPAEKALWDKYIDKIANREEAEDQGYFWPVTEAKVFEGSAVPVGSNFATPTQSVESTKEDPSGDTSPNSDPSSDTRKNTALFY